MNPDIISTKRLFYFSIIYNPPNLRLSFLFPYANQYLILPGGVWFTSLPSFKGHPIKNSFVHVVFSVVMLCSYIVFFLIFVLF